MAVNRAHTRRVEGLGTFGFALTDDNEDGVLTLTSADPTSAPRILHRFDLGGFRSAWETFCALLATPHLTTVQSLDASRPLDKIIAERLGPGFHAAGTCGIRRVVDDDLHVYGLERVMVADASVFPCQVSNNTNLTCYMIGERAAAKIDAAGE